MKPESSWRGIMGQAAVPMSHLIDHYNRSRVLIGSMVFWSLATLYCGFADNFAAYERYGALVGTPTVPVRAGGFVWVQLPVMITGRFKGGKPFGSSGNVVMRRPASGGKWQVVTDG